MAIKGTVSAGKLTLTYGEMSFGKNRGLSISIDGQEGSRRDYQIAPNPHNADSKWYNKNQAKFYKEAANAVAKKTKDSLPTSLDIEVNDVEYSLSER